jgi:hypothetical protein
MDTQTRRLVCRLRQQDDGHRECGHRETHHHTAERRRTDASGFDPETKFAFTSNGEGTLTVVHEDSADKFSVVENVATKKSARTMTVDLKTHNIFLPAADFDAPLAGERRGKMKPDSFVLLMLTR